MGIISEISSTANQNITRPESNFSAIMSNEYEEQRKAQNDHKLVQQKIQATVEAKVPNMQDLMNDVSGVERQEMGKTNNIPNYLENGIDNSRYLQPNIQQDNQQFGTPKDDGFER